MKIPTIKNRAEHVYRKLALIAAAAASDTDTLDDPNDVLAGIKEAAIEAMNDLYWVTTADVAHAAPTSDERNALLLATSVEAR